MFKRIPWKTGRPTHINRKSGGAIVFIGLGTNIGAPGERRRLLLLALQKLESAPATRVLGVSSLYETPPWGLENQAEFHNICAAIETGLSLVPLLRILKSIETRLGRKSRTRWGPREIDLDILLAGRQQIQTPGLQVPHKHLTQRDFAMIPLLELAPEGKLPEGRLLTSYLRR